jgi:hypothetical protein
VESGEVFGGVVQGDYGWGGAGGITGGVEGRTKRIVVTNPTKIRIIQNSLPILPTDLPQMITPTLSIFIIMNQFTKLFAASGFLYLSYHIFKTIYY